MSDFWGPNITISDRLARVEDMTEKECGRALARSERDNLQEPVCKRIRARMHELKIQRIGYANAPVNESCLRDIAMATLIAMPPLEQVRCAVGLMFSASASAQFPPALSSPGFEAYLQLRCLEEKFTKLLPAAMSRTTPGEHTRSVMATPPPAAAPSAAPAGFAVPIVCGRISTARQNPHPQPLSHPMGEGGVGKKRSNDSL